MALTTAKARRLPEFPSGLEHHPDWRALEAQTERVNRVLEMTRAEKVSAQAEREQRASGVQDVLVAEALCEEPSAPARIAAARRELEKAEERLQMLNERESAQEEAARRIEAQKAAFRPSIEAEQRETARRVMNELAGMLAERLEALSPIVQRMADGRRQFSVQPSSNLFFDELDTRTNSKLAAFIRGQR